MSEVTRNAVQIFSQSSLAEVIRKLRATPPHNEEAVIEELVRDTQKEVSSPVMSVKVVAIQKAVYFHMLGHSASYAKFNIVEAMADKVFAHKRIAYLAACTVFTPDTDVIPLTTALLRRDLHSAYQYESGLALYFIASVCTTNLAKDLISDVLSLLGHPRTYIRKKAVLSLYKLFLQYPDCIRPTYPRLKEKLEDSSELCDDDASVRGAVVCVLCELARRNPSNFLGLAVPFYTLLSNVQSNWTLIKIIKVFGYFASFEPRLGKKLVEPLTCLITTSRAKSVQYECLLAVANGMGNVSSLTHLAAEQLQDFANETDQNLKLLGLEAMSRLAATHPRLFHDQRDMILRCVGDVDVMIRRQALVLTRILITKKTLVSTVNYIIDHCQNEQRERLRTTQEQLRCSVSGTAATNSPSSNVPFSSTPAAVMHSATDNVWVNNVVATVIEMANTDDYSFIDDFEWYIGVLIDLIFLECEHFMHGELIERELVTILARVGAARQFGVQQLASLLSNDTLLHDHRLHCHAHRLGSTDNSSSGHKLPPPPPPGQPVSHAHPNSKSTKPFLRPLDSLLPPSSSCSTRVLVLRAAAFLCGEYPHWLINKRAVLTQLLSHEMTQLPAEVQLACVMAVSKIAAFAYQPCARHSAQHDGETEAATLPEDGVSYDEIQRAILATDEEDATRQDGEGAVDDATSHERTGNGNPSNSHPLVSGQRNNSATDADTVPCNDSSGLARFCHSVHPDVQERACLVRYQVRSAPAWGTLVYAKELPCVAAVAQEALDIPDDLSMDVPFCPNLDMLLAPHADRTYRRAPRRRAHAYRDGNDDSEADAEDSHSGSSETSSQSGERDSDTLSDEGEDREEDGSNFMARYRQAQQRRAEKERRKAVSVFYLRQDHTTVTEDRSTDAKHDAREADPNDASTLAVLMDDADGTVSENAHTEGGSAAAAFPVHRRGRAAAHSSKTFVIKRDLRMPNAHSNKNDYREIPSTPSAADAEDDTGSRHRHKHRRAAAQPHTGMSKWRYVHGRYAENDEQEMDEATQQLRRIDVTRALSAEEKLPEPKAYAAPANALAMTFIGGRSRSTMHNSDLGTTAGYALRNSSSSGYHKDLMHCEEATHSLAASRKDITSTPAASASLAHPAVTLCDTSLARVILYVEGCRWTRAGVELRCRLHTMNLVSYAALQDVCVALDARANGVQLRLRGEGGGSTAAAASAAESAVMRAKAAEVAEVKEETRRCNSSNTNDNNIDSNKSNDVTHKDEKVDTGTGVDAAHSTPCHTSADAHSSTDRFVYVASTMEPLSVVQTEVVLHWASLPSAALAQPVPLQLHYRKDRRRRTTEMTFSALYAYFAKHVVPSATTTGGGNSSASGMTPATFYTEVLTKGLNGASLVVGFVPCNRAGVLTSVTQMQRTLRLVAIGVYRDAMSLYGQMHTRRSTPDHAHVAVLLRETEQEKSRGVSVHVRSHHPAIAELLLDEIKMILSSNGAL